MSKSSKSFPEAGDSNVDGQFAFPDKTINVEGQFAFSDKTINVDGQFAFSDKTIRMAFIRKVYSILTAQLAVTGFLILLFIGSTSSNEFVAKNPGLLLVAIIVIIVTSLILICFKTVARSTPTNYIFLFLFTIAESFLLGVVAARIGTEQVMLAVGLTALICFSLTVYAFQTKIDFTVLYGILMTLLIVICSAGIIFIFLSDVVKPLRILYLCGSVLIFSLLLICDTQLMVAGDHKYALSPEDYVFASLSIYLDIINIFIYILRMFN